MTEQTHNGLPWLGDDYAGSDENRSQVVTKAEHYRIHEGQTFSSGFEGAAVADDGALDLLLTTDEIAHMTWAAYGTGTSEYAVYEDAEVSAVGAALTEVNLNRNSPLTASMVATSGPTVTSVGTKLFGGFFGGLGGGGEGLGRSDGGELVLKPSTIYLLRITNRSGGAQDMSVRASWYESPA